MYLVVDWLNTVGWLPELGNRKDRKMKERSNPVVPLEEHTPYFFRRRK